MIWCGIDVCVWLNKFYGFLHFSVTLYIDSIYVPLEVLTVCALNAISKMDGRGLSNTVHHEPTKVM